MCAGIFSFGLPISFPVYSIILKPLCSGAVCVAPVEPFLRLEQMRILIKKCVYDTEKDDDDCLEYSTPPPLS